MTTSTTTPIKSTTLYQQRRNGKVKVWKIEVQGSTLTTTWGQEGGKMQSQPVTAVAKGKEGTKSFKSPEAQAEIEYQRSIDKQIERGYVRDKNNLTNVNDMSAMTFDKPMTGFCPPKPIKTPPSNAVIANLIEENRFRVFKKYDGARVLVFFDKDGEPRMFTRTLEPCEDRFVSIMGNLKDMANDYGLYNTVLDCELYINDGEKLTDFDKVNSLMPRTKTSTAKDTIANWAWNTNRISLCIFDVIFFFGKYVLEDSFEQRWTILKKISGSSRRYYNRSEVHLPQEITIDNLSKWTEEVTKLSTSGWEGLVIRDCESASKATTDGKEVRPDGCWKFKIKKEDDFVATGYELGTGKNEKRVGKIKLQQIDATGKVLDCGACGLFLGEDSIRDEALNWTYPVVVRVEFDRRQEAGSSCKLRFPCVIAKRDDKKPEECVYNG